MKNKGFTLIELLAVIVILAIIALIATPIIIGIINDARDEARERSAELVYSGVENAYTQTLLKSNKTGEDITLNEIAQNINVDNVKSLGSFETDAETGDTMYVAKTLAELESYEFNEENMEALIIVTKDNVYCGVAKNTDTKTFDVGCATEEDPELFRYVAFTDEEYQDYVLLNKSINYDN